MLHLAQPYGMCAGRDVVSSSGGITRCEPSQMRFEAVLDIREALVYGVGDTVLAVRER
jgi:hypothetical protein